MAEVMNQERLDGRTLSLTSASSQQKWKQGTSEMIHHYGVNLSIDKPEQAANC